MKGIVLVEKKKTCDGILSFFNAVLKQGKDCTLSGQTALYRVKQIGTSTTESSIRQNPI